MIIKIAILIILIYTSAIKISKALKEYEEWKDKLDGERREE